MRLTKSLTATTPWVTRVSVVVQVSWTSQVVPRTVAALYGPVVRNLPLPLPQSLRDFGFFWAALAALFGLRAAGQLLAQPQLDEPADLVDVKRPS